MNTVEIGKIQRITSPNPFALLSACREDGSTNLMAVSWWTYVSNHPPAVAVCLSNKGLSGSLIEKNGEFGLCTVTEELKEAAFACGTCSGRLKDKAEEFQIKLMPSQEIWPQLVKLHKVALECRLCEKLALSDHTIYVGEIVAAHVNSDGNQLYAYDGYARLDTVNNERK